MKGIRKKTEERIIKRDAEMKAGNPRDGEVEM